MKLDKLSILQLAHREKELLNMVISPVSSAQVGTIMVPATTGDRDEMQVAVRRFLDVSTQHGQVHALPVALEDPHGHRMSSAEPTLSTHALPANASLGQLADQFSNRTKAV